MGKKSRLMLMEVMRDKGLLDAWRQENPEKRELTRRQMKEWILKQSRIDLVIVQGDTISYTDEDIRGITLVIMMGLDLESKSEGGRWVEGCGY